MRNAPSIGRVFPAVDRARPWIALALPCALLACRPHERARPRAHVYVSNERGGTVSVIDVARGVVEATIAVGRRPRCVRLGPDHRVLYVALSGSPPAPPGARDDARPAADHAADGIGVVDLARARLERVLPSGPDPEAFDLTPDGRRLYVSNEEDATVTVVDVARGSVLREVPVGAEPEGVAVRPDGRVVYVTSEAAGAVYVIDTATDAVIARVPTGPRPRAVAFDPDGARAFVTNEQGGSVTVIDARRHAVVRDVAIPRAGDGAPDARPMGARVAPDGRTLFVTTGRGGAVAFVATGDGRVLGLSRGVGPRPWGIDVAPDGSELYVANGPSNDVAALDAVTGATRRRFAVGASPWGVAVGP